MKAKITLEEVRKCESSYHNRNFRKSSLFWLNTYGGKGVVYLASRTTGIICGFTSSRAKMLDDYTTEVFEEYEILTACQYRKKWEAIL
jgi:hypothetical protein